jgi:protoporphyrin/coproporphyrin ferrochelatase
MSEATGVVLVSHGTVESMDDLPEFLANIRRGHEAPPELVAEMRRRYEAIGGRSPLNDISTKVAVKLGRRLDLPVRVAGRMFHPYPVDALRELAGLGVTRVLAIPLAQHSAEVYGAAVIAAAREVAAIREVVPAKNWGRRPELTRAFADALASELAKVPADEMARTAVVTTGRGRRPRPIPMPRSVRGARSRVSEPRCIGRERHLAGAGSEERALGPRAPWPSERRARAHRLLGRPRGDPL